MYIMEMRRPVRIITTSWDDGHKADLKLADVLRAQSIPATFYMSPHNREIAPELRLTDAEIVELGREFEIGAHTMTHPVLTQVTLDEARAEIVESKRYLEQLMGREIEMFCYPRGAYNAKIKRIPEEVGFRGARTVQPYQTGLPADAYAMGTTIHAHRTPANYALRLAMMHNPSFAVKVTSRDFVKVALRTLEHVQKQGGVWHLWGHSWEIDQEGLWDDLATVLKQAAGRPGFEYLTNGEVMKYVEDRRG